MKIVQINSTNYGSTGNIMLNLSELLNSMNVTNYVSYPKSKSNLSKQIENSLLIGSRLERNVHLFFSNIFGFDGLGSIIGTYYFIRRLKKLNPDIIHLHNLHSSYINLNQLFKYLSMNKHIKVVWTLHDCWSYTGKCSHYSSISCDKWKTECNKCPLLNEYPKSKLDNTKLMYRLKKRTFNNKSSINFITPSIWLLNQVKESYLSKHSVQVINNGIDLEVFRPIQSDFRSNHGLQDKIIILGVASIWTKKKGIDIFLEMASKLDHRFKVIIVGTVMQKIDSNVLHIPSTSNQTDLACIYSSADYFINPSVEETMGLVTIEAMACGIPVIVSNRTAIPEVVNNECGVIVDKVDSEGFLQALYNTIDNLHFDANKCVKQAHNYNKQIKYSEYFDLYKSLLEDK